MTEPKKPTALDVLRWMEEFAEGRKRVAQKMRDFFASEKNTEVSAMMLEHEAQRLREWIAHCREQLKEGRK